MLAGIVINITKYIPIFTNHVAKTGGTGTRITQIVITQIEMRDPTHQNIAQKLVSNELGKQF